MTEHQSHTWTKAQLDAPALLDILGTPGWMPFDTVDLALAYCEGAELQVSDALETSDAVLIRARPIIPESELP